MNKTDTGKRGASAMRRFNAGRQLLLLLLLSFFCVLGMERLREQGECYTQQKKRLTDPDFRAEFFSKIQREQFTIGICASHLQQVEREARYFPVPLSSKDTSLNVDFVDTWMGERTYGDKRKHEGCDLMAAVNQRGLYPVISISDGVVSNLGWNEKGGYRIGITSESGTYYYYAHLDSYSNVKKGDRVKAGELLGFMGDSGYGEEGTVGKFAVHLHVGIYFYEHNEEISVNPYFLLKELEKHKLIYDF